MVSLASDEHYPIRGLGIKVRAAMFDLDGATEAG